MSTDLTIQETTNSVTVSENSIAVTVAPTEVAVTVSTGPITIGGSSYSTQSGSGSPVGSVTPDFTGQIYFDTSSQLVYVSSGTTNSSWIELVRNF